MNSPRSWRHVRDDVQQHFTPPVSHISHTHGVHQLLLVRLRGRSQGPPLCFGVRSMTGSADLLLEPVSAAAASRDKGGLVPCVLPNVVCKGRRLDVLQVDICGEATWWIQCSRGTVLRLRFTAASRSPRARVETIRYHARHRSWGNGPKMRPGVYFLCETSYGARTVRELWHRPQDLATSALWTLALTPRSCAILL